MSIEAVHWALDAPVGGNAKVILIGVANHASPDGTGSYPALDTLASYAHCDRSTVRRNLRKLEEDGWLIRDGFGPHGTTCYRVPIDCPRGGEVQPVGDGEMPGGNLPQGGAVGVASGVAPMPPEPTTNKVGDESPTTPLGDRADLIEVFEYWRERCSKPDAKFTVERRRAVKARLAEGYTVLNIRQGIDGAATNPPVNRDTGMVYDDLVSICRNGSQLERYMERAGLAPGGRVVPFDRKSTVSELHRKLMANEGEAS